MAKNFAYRMRRYTIKKPYADKTLYILSKALYFYYIKGGFVYKKYGGVNIFTLCNITNQIKTSRQYVVNYLLHKHNMLWYTIFTEKRKTQAFYK